MSTAGKNCCIINFYKIQTCIFKLTVNVFDRIKLWDDGLEIWDGDSPMILKVETVKLSAASYPTFWKIIRSKHRKLKLVFKS